MPGSLFRRRLKLGTFFGIDLFVHWTFALVVGYVLLLTRDLGAWAIGFSLLQLFGVFLCVTLHEYGHALAARRYDIDTADITLLPIGGVARLVRMPRVPWQELVVAVAGPAVNVVIVLLILIGGGVWLGVSMWTSPGDVPVAINLTTVAAWLDQYATPSPVGFVIVMLGVNMMLVLFNMVPAFPMDGGRVFRALLAMLTNYTRATSIASKVGLVCAAIMLFVAVFVGNFNPPLMLIAIFIAYAGLAEARQVRVVERIRGLTVGDLMVRTTATIPMTMTLTEIAARIRWTTQPAIPVVSAVDTVVGTLSVRQIASAIAVKRLNRPAGEIEVTAGELIDHGADDPTVTIDQPLEDIIPLAGPDQHAFTVVDGDGRPIGLLDLDSLLPRVAIERAMRESPNV